MEKAEKVIKLLSLISVTMIIFLLGFVFYVEISKNNFIDNMRYAETRYNRSLQESNLRMLFFGDIMLDRHVGIKIEENGFDYLLIELDKENFFDSYNLIGCNLEGVVTNGGQHYSPQMVYDFAFDPGLIDQLHDYNFNFFNLANNHFSDQGTHGIIETRENLDNLGFNYVGCQDGKVDDCSSKILEINGQKIGMAGFSQVYSLVDLEKAKNVVSDLASSTDLVIVNIHWGVEYKHYFNNIQQNYARSLIDAGADIIIGHHPHVVQGMEIYNNKPIFYSLGNFIFDQYFSSDTQEGLAIRINILKNKKEFNLFPFKSKASQPVLMSTEDKEKFLQNFISWSEVDDEIIEGIKEGKIIMN